MSSESWNTECPVCGFYSAQDARDGHIHYTWCQVCSYHENSMEDAYEYAYRDCNQSAKEEIKRKNYKSKEEYEEALEEKTHEFIIKWIESEVGEDFQPNDSAIPEYKKVASMLNEFMKSLGDDYDWYDCIDLNDYDEYLKQINDGQTASWFFSMLSKDTIIHMLDGMFNA